MGSTLTQERKLGRNTMLWEEQMQLDECILHQNHCRLRDTFRLELGNLQRKVQVLP